MVTRAEVSTIVDAVGFEPGNLDREALKRDLTDVAIGLATREVIESVPDDKKRADRLATVQLRTEKLLNPYYS